MRALPRSTTCASTPIRFGRILIRIEYRGRVRVRTLPRSRFLLKVSPVPLAALDFRHSTPDVRPLASLLRAFRVALKPVFKAFFMGHAPGTKISEILLPPACPKKFGNFMAASMPTENFGNFITGSVSPSSYQNFRNFSTARFPKATKISEILVAGKIAPGTKTSETLVPRDRHARGFQKEMRQRTRLQGPGARTKKRRRPARHRFIRECLNI